MIDEHVKVYLENLIPPRIKKVEEIELYAKEHKIPIMDLIGMESLLQQLKLIQPKRILEIGTAIGYSAIRMAQALPEAYILTIERDQDRYEQALQNIAALGLADRIEVKLGDAIQVAELLETTPSFDVLFIDAAKGQYERFLTIYGSFLIKKGVVFSDNVLFRGLVGQEEIEHKRHRTLAKKVDSYNHWLMEHPDYETRILPVGDGLAVSIKK